MKKEVVDSTCYYSILYQIDMSFIVDRGYEQSLDTGMLFEERLVVKQCFSCRRISTQYKSFHSIHVSS